jgi:4-hydroxybenzoate polyprenyltransferase
MIALIIALLFLGYSVTIIAIGKVLYLLVYTAWFVMGSFYSAPPIKFKHRAVSGIICDTFMEKTIPVSLVFIYFKYFNYDTLIVIVLSFLIQFETIIHHQMEDYEGDLRTKIKTFVVKVGPERALAILNSYIRPLSIILILAFGFICSMKIPIFGPFFFATLAGYFFMNQLRKKGRLPPGKFVKFLHFGPYSYLYFCLQGPFLLFLGFLSTLRFPPYVSLFLMALASEYPLLKSYIKVFNASIAFLTGK